MGTILIILKRNKIKIEIFFRIFLVPQFYLQLLDAEGMKLYF